MSERRLLRVLCSRRGRAAHQVGTVVATPQGPRLRLILAVGTADGHRGVESEFEPAAQHEMVQAWCDACNRVLPAVPQRLLETAVGPDSGGAVQLSAEGAYRNPPKGVPDVG